MTQWHFRPLLYFRFLSKWPHKCKTFINTNLTTHIKNKNWNEHHAKYSLYPHWAVFCTKPLSPQALGGSPSFTPRVTWGTLQEPRLCFPSQMPLAQLQCQHTALKWVTLTPHCCEMQRLDDETHEARWASWQFYRLGGFLGLRSVRPHRCAAGQPRPKAASTKQLQARNHRAVSLEGTPVVTGCNLPAQGHPRNRRNPHGSWVSPLREAPQPLWAICSTALSPGLFSHHLLQGAKSVTDK